MNSTTSLLVLLILAVLSSTNANALKGRKLCEVPEELLERRRHLQGEDIIFDEEEMRKQVEEQCATIEGTVMEMTMDCGIMSMTFPFCAPAGCSATDIEELIEKEMEESESTDDFLGMNDCVIDIESSAPIHFSIFHVAGALIAAVSMMLI